MQAAFFVSGHSLERSSHELSHEQLISRLHASGARSFFQVAAQLTTVYNVKMTGSSGDLYAGSTAVFAWANFDVDGVHHFPHTAIAHNGLRWAVFNDDACV